MSKPNNPGPLEGIKDMFKVYKRCSSIADDLKPDAGFLINYLEKVFKNTPEPPDSEGEKTKLDKIHTLVGVVTTIRKYDPVSASEVLITDLDHILTEPDTDTVQDPVQVNENPVSEDIKPTVPIQQKTVKHTSAMATARESASTSSSSSSRPSTFDGQAEHASSSGQEQRQNLESASYDDGPAAVIGPVKKKISNTDCLRLKMEKTTEQLNQIMLNSSRPRSSSDGVSNTLAASNTTRSSNTAAIQDTLEPAQVNENTAGGNVPPTVLNQEKTVKDTFAIATTSVSAASSSSSLSSSSSSCLRPSNLDEEDEHASSSSSRQRQNLEFESSSHHESSSNGFSGTRTVRVLASKKRGNATGIPPTDRQLRSHARARSQPKGNLESKSQPVMSNQTSSSGNEVHKCSHCDKDCPTKKSLNRHMAYCMAPKKYGCKYCKSEFKISSQLTEHERTHTGEKPFQCKYCQRSFSQLGHLQYHERTHTGEEPYQCRHCPRSFKVHSSRRGHEKTHTGGETSTAKKNL